MGRSKKRAEVKEVVHAERRAERALKKESKKAAFIRHLSDTCNVYEACRLTPCRRNWAYEERDVDPAFAEAWKEALDVGIEKLELGARKRALHGVKEPVYHQGVVVGHVRKYSDTLTIFLLKAHRPEVYRERVDVRHGGEVKLQPMRVYLPSNGREVVVQGRLAAPTVEEEAK